LRTSRSMRIRWQAEGLIRVAKNFRIFATWGEASRQISSCCSILKGCSAPDLFEDENTPIYKWGTGIEGFDAKEVGSWV